MSELEKTDLKIFMLEAWGEALDVLSETGDIGQAGDKYREKVRAL